MDMSKFAGPHFLNLDDLANGPLEEKIIDVQEGRYGRPDLYFESGNRLSLNATNVRTLIRLWGKDSQNYIDKTVKLYIGDVPFEGKPQPTVLIQERNAPPAITIPTTRFRFKKDLITGSRSNTMRKREPEMKIVLQDTLSAAEAAAHIKAPRSSGPFTLVRSTGHLRTSSATGAALRMGPNAIDGAIRTRPDEALLIQMRKVIGELSDLAIALEQRISE